MISMPDGRPYTDAERRERHKRIFGEGSEPPEERLGIGRRLSNSMDGIPFDAQYAFGIAKPGDRKDIKKGRGIIYPGD